MDIDRLFYFIETSCELNLSQQVPHLAAEGFEPKSLQCRLMMTVDTDKDLEAFQHICRCYLALIQAEEYYIAIPCKIVSWPPGGPGRFRFATCKEEVELLFVLASSYAEQRGYYLKLAGAAEGRAWKMSDPPEGMTIEPEIGDLLPHGTYMTGTRLGEVQQLVQALEGRIFIALANKEGSIST